MKKSNIFILISGIGAGFYEYVEGYTGNLFLLSLVYLVYFLLARWIANRIGK